MPFIADKRKPASIAEVIGVVTTGLLLIFGIFLMLVGVLALSSARCP